MLDFDVIVIGKGLVGAAAAKYLACRNISVAIIGADEPRKRVDSLVYASHYDQARVQRLVGKDEVWTQLNIYSARQYECIQRDTGIDFHISKGCLYVNPYGSDAYLETYKALAEKFDIRHTPLQQIAKYETNTAGFVFPDKAQGVLEYPPAGYINPRLLIEAQLTLFQQKGGVIYPEVVTCLQQIGNTFLLLTANGNMLSCGRVLVATGSFINHFEILPQKLKLLTKSEVVLLVKIEEELLPQYEKLPALLYEMDEDEVEGLYLVPPVKYPDGNYYLKLGCNSPHDHFFDSLEQIQQWFRNGETSVFVPALAAALKKILPNISTNEIITKKCVISRTATGRPYIGETNTKGLYIAGGCNGYSAMCSDAMGSVAAQVILHHSLPDKYPKDAFKIKYANEM